MNSPSFNRAVLCLFCVVLLNGFGRLCQAQAPNERLLNIDFAALPNRTESLKTGPAVLGISTNDYWNLYRRSLDLADT
ncbi:MAG TPA: hypothetical protein VHI52_16185, partial [Verrucomicrobiae bacterium]|nr:hypothetical protein [Verrucomicrobiae bacterium]